MMLKRSTLKDLACRCTLQNILPLIKQFNEKYLLRSLLDPAKSLWKQFLKCNPTTNANINLQDSILEETLTDHWHLKSSPFALSVHTSSTIEVTSRHHTPLASQSQRLYQGWTTWGFLQSEAKMSRSLPVTSCRICIILSPQLFQVEIFHKDASCHFM